MCVGHKLVPADPLELFIAVKVVLNLMKVTYFNLPNMGHFFRDTLYNAMCAPLQVGPSLAATSGVTKVLSEFGYQSPRFKFKYFRLPS